MFMTFLYLVFMVFTYSPLTPKPHDFQILAMF